MSLVSTKLSVNEYPPRVLRNGTIQFVASLYAGIGIELQNELRDPWTTGGRAYARGINHRYLSATNGFAGEVVHLMEHYDSTGVQ